MSDNSYGSDDDYSDSGSHKSDDDAPQTSEEQFSQGEMMMYEKEWSEAIKSFEQCLAQEKQTNTFLKSASSFEQIIKCTAKMEDYTKIINTLIPRFIEEVKGYDQFLKKNMIGRIKSSIQNLDDETQRAAAMSKFISLLSDDGNMVEIWFNAKLESGERAAKAMDSFGLKKIIDEIKVSSFYKTLGKNLKDYETVNSFLGINSLEIQLCFLKNDYETLRRIVKVCSKIPSDTLVSASNKYSAWFYEAAGRIALLNYDYENAEDFLKRGFKHAEAISIDKKRDVLKLYCIANILSNNNLSSFADEDAKAFSGDVNTFAHYYNLRKHYDNKDHREFVRCMKEDCMIERDDFLKQLIPELKRNILQIFVKKIITCYTVLSQGYLERELSQTKQQTRSIILEMINKKELKGYLDDVSEVFENHGTVLTEQERKELQGNIDDKKIVDDDEINNLFKENVERMVENVKTQTYTW